ncbi:MAG: FtsW/RodA/SpoVE family cell cycle protein [Oscillospiraceae bacterium]|nr:FtsW/RodA/SpoVE family cell cycle protein [Oscillospiraceae bacterium]
MDKILLALCVIASLFSVYLLYTINLNGINPGKVSPRTWKIQLITMAAGIAFALVIASINYRLLSRLWFVYSGLALLTSLLLFTPLGVRTEGATDLNWLDLGFIQIQPSEFLKVAFIMTFATHLCKAGDKMNHPRHFALLCLHGMVPVGLVIIQDDTGTALIILMMFLTMMFAAGLSWKYILAGLVGFPVLGVVFWNFYAQPHHKMRILVLIDKELQQKEAVGLYDQQRRSLMALGSGGLTGQGLSGGNYVYIFAIHNDFIFAYIGMTLGFVGCAVTLALLLLICVKIIAAAGAAKDLMGKLICVGAFSMIFFHSVINVGMVIAVTPVVGVPLPFISAGGSSTLALYCAVGLVLSVWAHKEKKYHMFYTETD